MINIFSLHGKYFKNDENRLTANFLFLLSENRQTFLQAFLKKIGLSLKRQDLVNAKIIFQSHLEETEQSFIPDAEIKIDDMLHILIEAKVAHNHLYEDQIKKYSSVVLQNMV
jgi:hypothetical protein